MDRPIRTSMISSTFHSLPVNDEATTSDHDHLALIPLSSSRASSATVNGQDDYAHLQPTVHTHGWKPETMQPTVLLALALASVLLAALLEILAQKSVADGALCLVDTAADIPPLVSFAHLYLPTITAVLYSLAWNWVDLDVKRMQPWLQLSRPEGATGRDSLFLDYPVDFVAFVPFRAAKKRHWASFYSGTIVVFVFWVLTPMQGAVFGTAPVLSSRIVNMTYPLALMDLASQATALSQAVLNRGYAITWLDQDLPAFTTPRYALRPFSPSPPLGPSPTGDLHCWPAIVQTPDPMPPRNGPVKMSFLDGRGCNATGVVPHPGIPQAAPYKMLYIGYQDSAWADQSLEGPGCGRTAWNTFLATWAVFHNETGRATGLAAFCETSYWKQNVTATVVSATATRRPVDASVRPRGPPEPLPEAEFNSSAFQYLLGAGVSPVDVPRDLPFTKLLEHYSRLSNVSIGYPLSPMVGFALGYYNASIAQYADLRVMTEAYTAVHKMLFSVAYAQLLVDAPSTAASADEQEEASSEGRVSTARYGVVVNRTFSALVEGFLGLVAVLALLLLKVCRGSACMLSGEPSSLQATVELTRNSSDGELQDVFSRTGHMGDEELRLRLGGYRFRLQCGCLAGASTPTLCVAGRPDDEEEQASEEELVQKEFSQMGYLAPVKPFVLRPVAGVLSFLVIAAALVAIIYLKRMDSLLGGLQRPSTNLEINKILTNYLPTTFSTLVEPVWVLLNRHFCMIQPFSDLLATRRPKWRTQQAMRSQYSALPPQLTVFHAIRARHVLLAAVCVTALLGNVLAVGLGALLNQLPRRVAYPTPLAPLYQTSIADDGLAVFVHKTLSVSPSPYRDPFYVVMANLSYGTALPAWSTPEFRFLPLDADAAADAVKADPAGTGLFAGETTGFGVEPGCRVLGTYTSVHLPAAMDMRYPNANAEANRTCAATYLPYPALLNDTRYQMPSGRASVETVDTSTDTYDSSACDETLVVGWSRAASVASRANATIRTSALACSPTLRTARFRIVFDAAGHVHAATPASDFTAVWPYRNATRRAQQQQRVISALHYNLRNRLAPWHNDTVARDWLNYLLVLRRGGVGVGDGRGGDERAMLDPAAPLPDAGALLPDVEAVYKVLFVTFLSLTPELFATTEAGAQATVDGTQTIEETRVFVSTPAFAVSVAILGLYLVMVVAYFVAGVRLFLPRMPSTVGSVLSFVAPSSVVTRAREDVGGETFCFGRYTGHDGRAQLGIDYADRVVPLDLKTLGQGDTRPRKLARLRSAHQQGELAHGFRKVMCTVTCTLIHKNLIICIVEKYHL